MIGCPFYQLHLHQSYEKNDVSSYELEGLESLGSMLRIVSQSDGFVDLSRSTIQWFRVQPEGNKKEIISGETISIKQNDLVFTYDVTLMAVATCYWSFIGAIKQAYAPEPHDVGRYLQAEINHCGEISVVKTAGPVDPG